MKTRFSNIVTTVLGLIVLAAAAAFVYLKLATMKEAMGFMIIGGALLFSKDKEFMDNFIRITKNIAPGSGGGSSNTSFEAVEEPKEGEEQK